jgi:hypothetical protein
VQNRSNNYKVGKYFAIRLIARSQASVGERPLPMSSTIDLHGVNRIITSPSPLSPQPPISLSAYAPAPGIAASPTRPGILKLAPFVDVPATILPDLSLTIIAIVS